MIASKTHSIIAVITNRPYDPEGFLGVLSACTLTYCGLMAGRCCVLFSEHKSRLLRWLLWGVTLLFLAGMILRLPDIIFIRLSLWIQTEWWIYAN